MKAQVNEAGEVQLVDGRQSPRAAMVQRGVCCLLRGMGFAAMTELVLSGGRRADIAAIGRDGEIWIVEIKSSVEDFRTDQKWPEYGEFCDRLFFAIPHDVPQEILPNHTGLIVADAYGAEILRQQELEKLSAARRKAMLLRIARAGAHRLHDLIDPGGTAD